MCAGTRYGGDGYGEAPLLRLQRSTHFAPRLPLRVCLSVTGQDCGGIRASMGRMDMGLIDGWLRGLKDIARLHKEEVCACDWFGG